MMIGFVPVVTNKLTVLVTVDVTWVTTVWPLRISELIRLANEPNKNGSAILELLIENIDG